MAALLLAEEPREQPAAPRRGRELAEVRRERPTRLRERRGLSHDDDDLRLRLRPGLLGAHAIQRLRAAVGEEGPPPAAVVAPPLVAVASGAGEVDLAAAVA